MHVRIRKVTAGTKENDVLLNVSKSTQIKALQTMISKKLNVGIDQQKLYHRGKELIGDHRITDYDIKLNDVIQLLIKSTNEESDETPPQKGEEINQVDVEKEATSGYFKKGDRIDVLDSEVGAWFEAKILNIYTKKAENVGEDDLIFKIKMDRNVENAPIEVQFKDIRPRARYVYKYSELKPGMVVLVNYNVEEPSTLGYWYDFKIKKVTKKILKGTLLMGTEDASIEDCVIKMKDEVMKIENSVLLTEREEYSEDIPLRKLPLYCSKCRDNPTKICRDCGCKICFKKDNEGILILCDECDDAYHLNCLKPPLEDVPTDSWYCPNCKIDDSEIVRAGEKLKMSKKKMKMVSNKEGRTTRDWGKGMACVGRTQECTIVPKDHYGPIPGIEVGTCWKFRTQVSEAGIHRPHVAGIHGRENDGAYSIVLSGGYEDDVDFGEEFYYTGSGGRDLSGNRRVNEQSFDQKLTRMNKALALNCNVKFNDTTGGKAEDWREGKPVRVVRNYKLRKHSKYAPLDGNRYDGIYKVVEYFPEKGKSGFIVWRYLLRRDDPSPAPWEKGGREFDMIYPEGYLEALEPKNDVDKVKKRKSITDYFKDPKKSRIQPFELDREVERMINDDILNEKLWNECMELLKSGKQEFLDKVKELFICVCCQELLHEPITITCTHNVCKTCLKRSFAAEIYVCPWCRFDLKNTYVVKENENLGRVLKNLFPGYEAGR